MLRTLDPFRFLLFAVAGWMNQMQQHAIEYLREETESFVLSWAADDFGSLLEKLANHMRLRCQRLDTASESFRQYARVFQTLRQSFDVGIFNLNYDTAALTAMPGAYTGFNRDGDFEPHSVHSRAHWDYVYHLHGSVHHSLIASNIDRIQWRSDLAGAFVDSDGNIGPVLRSRKVLFPKASLLAGGFKLDQLLAEPFHSLHAALVRQVYAADAIVLGGYGFGDGHVNRALRNCLSGMEKRPPTLILDCRSALTLLKPDDQLWATQIRATLDADSSFFRRATDAGSGSCSTTGSFEVDRVHRVALWTGGFAEAASRIDAIVLWLNGKTDLV